MLAEENTGRLLYYKSNASLTRHLTDYLGEIDGLGEKFPLKLVEIAFCSVSAARARGIVAGRANCELPIPQPSPV